MPINVNDPEYIKAEKRYFEARTIQEKLEFLKKMISHAPKHKGGENLRQQLTQRRKKFEQEIEKKKKKKKNSKEGIKKREMQAVLIGKTNSGKSSILKILTNAEPLISERKFSTNKPIIGMINYKNCQIQLIEIPAIEGDHFEKGIVHTADTILIVVNKIKEIEEIEKLMPQSFGKKIILFNKLNFLSLEEERKIKETLKSKRYQFIIFSSLLKKNKESIEELKTKIFNSFEIIRIFTKEPGKEASQKPIIMKPNSTVKDVAEKIFKNFSKKIKKTKIWGPSSKFSGQIVGLKHPLKDLDVLEFTTG